MVNALTSLLNFADGNSNPKHITNAYDIDRAINNLNHVAKDGVKDLASVVHLGDQYHVESNQYTRAVISSDTSLINAQTSELRAEGYLANAQGYGSYGPQLAATQNKGAPPYNALVDAVAHATENPTQENKDRALNIASALAMRDQNGHPGPIVLRGKYDVGENGVHLTGTFNGGNNYDSPEAAVADISKHIARNLGSPALTVQSLSGVDQHGPAPFMGPPAPAPVMGSPAPAAVFVPVPSHETKSETVALPPIPSAPVVSTPTAPAVTEHAAAAKPVPAVETPAPVAATPEPAVATPAKADHVPTAKEQTALNQQAQALLEELHHSTGDKNHKAVTHGHADAASMEGINGKLTQEALKAEGIDATKPIDQTILAQLKANVEKQHTAEHATADKTDKALNDDTTRTARMAEALKNSGHAPTPAEQPAPAPVAVTAPAASTSIASEAHIDPAVLKAAPVVSVAAPVSNLYVTDMSSYGAPTTSAPQSAAQAAAAAVTRDVSTSVQTLIAGDLATPQVPNAKQGQTQVAQR